MVWAVMSQAHPHESWHLDILGDPLNSSPLFSENMLSVICSFLMY